MRDFFIALGFLVVIGLGFTLLGLNNNAYSESEATHNRMHKLIIDSIQMHDQFERNYECDNYYPCPVSVECELIKK